MHDQHKVIYVTGSGKRYTVAHTMIFLYKRCSKTRSVKDKAKYIVCQNGRSKSSLICHSYIQTTESRHFV